MLIHGQCHCANIVFQLRWAGDANEIPARACRCSFCTQHGGVWTAHGASALEVAVNDRALISEYAFETKTATFHVCARCGAVPVVSSEIAGRRYAVVNVNTFRDVDESRLVRAAADFEGEDETSRLSRRAKTWIGNVSFTLRDTGNGPGLS